MDLLATLEMYVAVAEARSFTRAAETLGVPQPVLSRRIQALEVELGAALFDRTRRQIEVTDLGRTLLPLARDLLDRADAVLETARTLQGSAHLTVGVPPDSDGRALADLVAAASSIGISLTVRDLPAAERGAALGRGELSTAVVRVPDDMARMTVPVGLAARDDVATPGRRTVHLEDLRARRAAPTDRTELLVAPEDQLGPYRDHLTGAAARAGLVATQVRDVHSTAEAVVSVLSHGSVLLCSEACAQSHHLTWRPLRDEGLARGYDLQIGAAAGAAAARRLVSSLTPDIARAIGAELPTGASPSTTPTSALLGARP